MPLQKLEEIEYPQGTGIPGLTAGLVERKRTKAIYLRSDDVYEVFKIKVLPAGEVYGVFYPEREVYPCNESFGHTAWTYRTYEKARHKYNKI